MSRPGITRAIVPAPGPQVAVAAGSSTPTVRAMGRKAVFWVIAAFGALLVAVAGTLLAGGSTAEGPTLGANNPAPGGGMALAEVLRQQGVTVTVANSFTEAQSAASGASDPTVLFYDEGGYLASDRLPDVADLAARTVVISPDFLALQALAQELGFGGVSDAEELAADCDVPAAVRAGTLSPGGSTLRLTESAGDEYTGCFPSDDETFSVIQRATTSGTLTFVAPTAAFTNDEVATYGNAALALNLLGAGDTLVWYLPTLADVERTGPPSLGELTPGWVTPTLLLLIVTFVAAATWRGRRFGPLVAENLPVAVKASETMEGRARLYARSSARLRAIDALRVGTVGRLAQRVGLSRSADMDEVIDAVSTLTGRPSHIVRAILLDDIPSTDSELLRLSDALLDLENETARATDLSSGGHHNGRMEP
jgi:Domain of unknown function (DUF4350)